MVAKIFDFFTAMPLRFALILPLALVVIAFQALCAFDFDVSPLNATGNVVSIYIGGYLPSLLILAVQCAHGLATPNEDRELLRQRRQRGEDINRELGIVPKPSWWRRIHGGHSMHMRDIIARNVAEVNGKDGVKDGVKDDGTALKDPAKKDPFADDASQNGSTISGSTVTVNRASTFTPYAGKSERRRAERTLQHAASLLFPNAESSTPSREEREAELTLDGPPPSYDETTRRASRMTTNSDSTVDMANGKPQRVKSMLDI